MFKTRPFRSGTYIKVTHQAQSVLAVESPVKVNPSPLNSLTLGCGKRTDTPLLSAEFVFAAAATADSENGD